MGSQVVPLYVVFGSDRTVSASRRSPTTRPSSRSCARRSPCPRPPSRRSATSSACFEPLLATGPATWSRSTSRRASPAPATPPARPPSSSSARARAASASAWSTRTTTAGGLGLRGARRRRGRCESRRRWTRCRAARPGGARGPQDLVRRRHARVPQARRADRRGQRLDRIDAEGQADPHAGERADPRRARTHQLAGVRAAGGLRPPAPRVRRRRLGRPAHLRGGPGRATGGALPRGVRLRPGVRQRGRARALGPRGPGPARHRGRSPSTTCAEPQRRPAAFPSSRWRWPAGARDTRCPRRSSAPC